MEEENKKEQWADIVIARKVLNFRRHNAQTNPGDQQLEHIVERKAGGAHSSENLALTLSTVNNRLGVLFGQPYASHEAPPGLPGTGGLPLRQFLRGQPAPVHEQWKQHFYAQLGVSVKPRSSARGVWKELS